MGVKNSSESFLLCVDSGLGENTSENLLNRRYSIVGWCYMCQSCGETVDYLLLYCNVAFELWSFVIRSFRIQWVLMDEVFDYYVGGEMGELIIYSISGIWFLMFDVDY